jgi:hypothetical protein
LVVETRSTEQDADHEVAQGLPVPALEFSRAAIWARPSSSSPFHHWALSEDGGGTAHVNQRSSSASTRSWTTEEGKAEEKKGLSTLTSVLLPQIRLFHHRSIQQRLALAILGRAGKKRRLDLARESGLLGMVDESDRGLEERGDGSMVGSAEDGAIVVELAEWSRGSEEDSIRPGGYPGLFRSVIGVVLRKCTERKIV